MKKTARSLGYSVAGLTHAFQTEANLRRFLLGHVFLMLMGLLAGIDLFSILAGTIMAGFFVTIELLNTAIERIADTVDDNEKKSGGGYYHAGIKFGKDVAAAASLVALCVYALTITLLALPYLIFTFMTV